MPQGSPQVTQPTEAFTRYRDALSDVFAELADLFGNPRSHGLIYGLLFSSLKPLSMDEISEQLGISKGSASQGLRALEELSAVVRTTKGRASVYSAKLELKNLIIGFMNSRLIPRLESSRQKLSDISGDLRSMLPQEMQEAKWRLDRVIQWHDRASQFLPIAQSVIGAGTVLSRNPFSSKQ